MTSGTQAEKSKRVATSAAISVVREPFMSRAKAWVSVADSRCSRVYHSAKVSPDGERAVCSKLARPALVWACQKPSSGTNAAARSMAPACKVATAAWAGSPGPGSPAPAGRWLLDQMASQGDQQLLFAVGVQAVQPWNQVGPRRRGFDLKANLGQHRARLSGLAEQRQQQPRPQ